MELREVIGLDILAEDLAGVEGGTAGAGDTVAAGGLADGVEAGDHLLGLGQYPGGCVGLESALRAELAGQGVARHAARQSARRDDVDNVSNSFAIFLG